jgi:hypothetical protein
LSDKTTGLPKVVLLDRAGGECRKFECIQSILSKDSVVFVDRRTCEIRNNNNVDDEAKQHLIEIMLQSSTVHDQYVVQQLRVPAVAGRRWDVIVAMQDNGAVYRVVQPITPTFDNINNITMRLFGCHLATLFNDEKMKTMKKDCVVDDKVRRTAKLANVVYTSTTSALVDGAEIEFLSDSLVVPINIVKAIVQLVGDNNNNNNNVLLSRDVTQRTNDGKRSRDDDDNDDDDRSKKSKVRIASLMFLFGVCV